MPGWILRKLDFVNSDGGFCAGVDFVETGFCEFGECILCLHLGRPCTNSNTDAGSWKNGTHKLEKWSYTFNQSAYRSSIINDNYYGKMSKRCQDIHDSGTPPILTILGPQEFS